MCCAGLSRSVSDSLQPCGLKPSRLLCPWGFSRQESWSGLPCPPPGDLPNPGIKPRSPALQTDSLLSEPPGKPKNTGVGSLSLLWEDFPIQEMKQGLLHCRWILSQLSFPTLCRFISRYFTLFDWDCFLNFSDSSFLCIEMQQISVC